MVEKEVEIVNKLGIHARPATSFVQLAEKFKSNIVVEKDGFEVNGKSILGMMMLVAPKGSRIKIKANGPDEKKALEALVKLVEDGFGEE